MSSQSIPRDFVDLRPLFACLDEPPIGDADYVARELRDCLLIVLDATRESDDGWDPSPSTDNATWNEDAHIRITLTVGELRRMKRAAETSVRSKEDTNG